MAGITTSSLTCKPLLPRITTPLSLSSFESSSISGVRLTTLTSFLRINPTHYSIYFTSQSSITARYSGYRPTPRPSPRPSPGGRSRDKREPQTEDDPSLDISSVRSTSVRLIDAQQNMIGVVSKSEAIQMAEDAQLDLVILSPDAEPPVLRIMDYNKYRYEQQKKKREQQKKSASTRMDMKELKMGYNIDSHDYSVRLRAAQKFLKEGDKVKVIVNLKGRQNEFKNIAIELLKRFQSDIGELGTEESKSFRERNMFLVLLPNKTILQKGPETQQKKKDQPAEVTETIEQPAEVTETIEQPAEVTEISATV